MRPAFIARVTVNKNEVSGGPGAVGQATQGQEGGSRQWPPLSHGLVFLRLIRLEVLMLSDEVEGQEVDLPKG